MFKFLLGVLILASNFFGVSRAIADPCQQITTAQDLQNIGTNAATLSGNYCLANDIDASITATWNGGAGFVPIGNVSDQFSGTLNGNGHTIDKLTINSAAADVGLFGDISATGVVTDVKLTNVAVTVLGGGHGGAVAGVNFGRITGSFASGSVTGVSASGVGGLVGENAGTLLVSVRRDIESYESFVIQGWWPDSKGGHPCGRQKTACDTTAASYAIRAI